MKREDAYGAFKALGWKPRIWGGRLLSAEFGDMLFVGGDRGKRRTRKQVLAAAERDIRSGKALWLERKDGFYRKSGALPAKYASAGEMALRLAAMGFCQ